MYYNSCLIKGHVFKFRNPSKRELDGYKSYAGKNQYKLQQKVIEACLIEPKVSFATSPRINKNIINLTSLPFLIGDIRFLYKEITKYTELNASVQAELVKYVNQYIESEEGRYDTLAAMALPGLDPSKMEDLDPFTRAKMWSMGLVAANANGFDSRIVLDPKAYEEYVNQVNAQNQMQIKMREAEEQLAIMNDPKLRRQKQQRMEGSGSFSVGTKY